MISKVISENIFLRSCGQSAIVVTVLEDTVVLPTASKAKPLAHTCPSEKKTGLTLVPYVQV